MRGTKITLHATAIAVLCIMGCTETVDAPAPSPESEATVVRFANLPYADHTYSVIGEELGFFEDAGIEIQSKTIRIEEVVSGLANGVYDVVSVPPGILFSSYESVSNARTFVFGDLFQGFALMADPSREFVSYSQFRESGLDHDSAVSAVVSQTRGKKFAYPTETAVRPFIDLILASIEPAERDEIERLVLDDPLTVAAMRSGRADFQVGGVPSRITLQKEGFVPLISSVDLARGAAASAESAELAAILQNGWATTQEYYDENRETVLRLAGVNYRIMEYMKTDREDAIGIHMRYLTKVTGVAFDAADGAVIYDWLDPFFTFEEQRPWFHDPEDPLFYLHVNGAHLATFVRDGIYETEPPSVDDVILADDVYLELERLRDASAEDLAKLASADDSLSAQQVELRELAQQHFDRFNFLDAERLSSEALLSPVGSTP